MDTVEKDRDMVESGDASTCPSSHSASEIETCLAIKDDMSGEPVDFIQTVNQERSFARGNKGRRKKGRKQKSKQEHATLSKNIQSGGEGEEQGGRASRVRAAVAAAASLAGVRCAWGRVQVRLPVAHVSGNHMLLFCIAGLLLYDKICFSFHPSILCMHHRKQEHCALC